MSSTVENIGIPKSEMVNTNDAPMQKDTVYKLENATDTEKKKSPRIPVVEFTVNETATTHSIHRDMTGYIRDGSRRRLFNRSLDEMTIFPTENYRIHSPNYGTMNASASQHTIYVEPVGKKQEPLRNSI